MVEDKPEKKEIDYFTNPASKIQSDNSEVVLDTTHDLDNIHNIRTLCADIVQKASSGHPGAPIGLSNFMYILYTEFISIDLCSNQRDIFILSNGHACAILYLMNYLLGYLEMEDLKQFRQLNSKTPGHPEKNVTKRISNGEDVKNTDNSELLSSGIEITTGPLGQGVANAIGFALSSKLQNLDNHIYCVFGDGCYQEGISQEAFSLLAKLHKEYNLDNITYIYDYNKVTIDGSTELSMNENVFMRFKSLGFEVIEIEDYINNHTNHQNIICENSNSTNSPSTCISYADYHSNIRNALLKKVSKPKIIILHTTIGRDTIVANSCKSHGNPLGEEEVIKLKQLYGIPNIPFHISETLKERFLSCKKRMESEIKRRESNCNEPTDYRVIEEQDLLTENASPVSQSLKHDNSLSKNYSSKNYIYYNSEYESVKAATRKHLSNALNGISSGKPIICGCADLLPSCLCKKENTHFIHFGIREHSMFGVMNGIGAHSHFIPICGTFFNFVSYGFPTVRLSSLDQNHIIYILTHDSIGLGEDGPTHQPIETMATLRATPGLVTMRPCDGLETRVALKIALEATGPVAIILTRQTVSEIKRYFDVRDSYTTISKGAYFIERDSFPQIVILATGSEVSLALETAYKVRKDKSNKNILRVAVVSFWSWELFEEQDDEYKEYIFHRSYRQCDSKVDERQDGSTDIVEPLYVSIEALSTFGWSKYAQLSFGIDSFGRSAPGADVFEFFEFTSEKISDKILNYFHKLKDS